MKNRNIIFPRTTYMEKLYNQAVNESVVILCGMHETGKSYILFDLFPEYLLKHGVSDSQIIKIKLQKSTNKNLRQPKDLKNYIYSNIDFGKRNYLLIDEPQLLNSIVNTNNNPQNGQNASWKDIINMAQGINAKIYITGSDSNYLSNSLSENIDYHATLINIGSMTFLEYHEGISTTANKFPTTLLLNQYLKYGGLPKVYQFESNKEKLKYLEKVNNKIITEIINKYKIRNSNGLIALCKYCASNVGRFLNPYIIQKNICDYGAHVSRNTINKYLKYLQEANYLQIMTTKNFSRQTIINSKSKYFFDDIGLCNQVFCQTAQNYNGRTENAIHNHIIKQGWDVSSECINRVISENHKSKRKKHYIDFVAQKVYDKVYFISAYDNADIRDLNKISAPLTYVKDSYKKIVITHPRIIAFINDKGLCYKNLIDFLLSSI